MMNCPKCGKENDYDDILLSYDSHVLYYVCEECGYHWAEDKLKRQIILECDTCEDKKWEREEDIHKCKKCGKMFCWFCGEEKEGLCNDCYYEEHPEELEDY